MFVKFLFCKTLAGAPYAIEGDARIATLSNFSDSPLSHPENNEICLGIGEDRGAEFILLVVVVDKATEGGFNSTEDNGTVFVTALGKSCIDNRSPVWPASVRPTSIISTPGVPLGGVVIGVSNPSA